MALALICMRTTYDIMDVYNAKTFMNNKTILKFKQASHSKSPHNNAMISNHYMHVHLYICFY